MVDYTKMFEKDKDKIISDFLIEMHKKRIDELENTLQQIKSWCRAYPVKIFPEPDFKKAAKVLKENDMTIDSISASNMRHILEGIQKIITETEANND